MSENGLTWTNGTRKLSELTPQRDNPRQIRKEKAKRLVKSWHKFNQPDVISIGPDNKIYNGHQRFYVWQAAYGNGFEVAVRIASRPLTKREWQEFTVLMHEGTVAEWDFDTLANWEGIDVGDLVEWGFDEEFLLGAWLSDEADKEREAIKGKQPNPRELPLDVIYTLDMADCTCCLAVQAGLKYGFQSAQYRLCPYCGELSGRHKVEFIDNDFKDYDHKRHLNVVAEHNPKYATVRDIMSEQQCKGVGITFYPFDQIMRWAEQLNECAEKIIVIPKIDCLHEISDEYILGYSVPTSYGGTPMSAEKFRGREVHLLGGSWKAQLEYLALLGNDVVSLDTNYVQRQATLLGVACSPTGDEFQMQDVGYSYLTNVRYAALALSFGAIGAKVNELYSGDGKPA